MAVVKRLRLVSTHALLSLCEGTGVLRAHVAQFDHSPQQGMLTDQEQYELQALVAHLDTQVEEGLVRGWDHL